MNLKNEFNRLSSYFETGADKMHTMTEDLGESMRSGTSRARDGLRYSKDALMSAQDTLTHNMKDHPVVYIGTALMVAGLILAAMMYSSGQRRTLRYQQW